MTNGHDHAPPYLTRAQWLKPGLLSEVPPERTWLVKDNEDGIIPLSEVGLVVGAGGTSKTYLMLSLVISVALGRPWLGRFTIASPGSCAVFLAEESFEECHRRLFYICEKMQLSAAELRTVERHIFCAPLAGVGARLLDSNQPRFGDVPKDEDGEAIKPDHVATAIGNWLHNEARGPWRLIIFDSLARFSSETAEKDNAAAASFVNVLERFTTLQGRPTVACVHHTNLSSRSTENKLAKGPLNPRGVSALHDNCRWVLTLHPEEATEEAPPRVSMRVAKSNYGPTYPHVSEVVMQRGDRGILSVVDESVLVAEKEAKVADRFVEDEDMVFRTAQKYPGQYKTKTALAMASGGRKTDMLKAVDRLLQQGRILMNGGFFTSSSKSICRRPESLEPLEREDDENENPE